MDIKTKFNCGDKGWTFTGSHVVQRTIGQIRTQFTNSAGIGDGYMEGGVATYSGSSGVADNYAPMSEEYIESYMCVETGIGSGHIYEFGETMFLTEEDCRIACAEAIRREEERKETCRQYEREQEIRREASLRSELARIEARKAAIT